MQIKGMYKVLEFVLDKILYIKNIYSDYTNFSILIHLEVLIEFIKCFIEIVKKEFILIWVNI